MFAVWSHRPRLFCPRCETSRVNQQRLELETRSRIAMRNFVRNILRRWQRRIRHSPLRFSLCLSFSFSLVLIFSSVRFLRTSRHSRSLTRQSIWFIFSTLNGVEPINFGIRHQRKRSSGVQPLLTAARLDNMENIVVSKCPLQLKWNPRMFKKRMIACALTSS